MDNTFEMITVDAENVDRQGFFCYMSKRKAPGYCQKHEWLVQRFDDAPFPTFPTDWEARQARFGAGLTVVRTPQCPYIEDAVTAALEFAAENGIPSKVVTLQSAQDVQGNSPSPYGVFGIVLDGKLLTYHYLLRKDFDKLAPRSL